MDATAFIFVYELRCASTPFIYAHSPPPLPTLPFAGFLLSDLPFSSLCLPHSLGPSVTIENCMETVPERSEERRLPLACLHSTLTRDWPQAST